MSSTEDRPPQVEPGGYDTAFFDYIDLHASASAARVVPHVVGLLEPASVVDVGCGHGAWLAEFERTGIVDVTGVDGDWVPESSLRFRSGSLIRHDLGTTLRADRRFDLVVSLETAEHLAPARGPGFVADLIGLGDAVLFSAAPPGQGGVDHVNEQWPDHWVGLFRAHGYVAIDCIRWQFWNDPEVSFYYAQNTFLAVRESTLVDLPRLQTWIERHPGAVGAIPPVVHPAMWLRPTPPVEVSHSTRELARALVHRTILATRVHTRRLRGHTS